MSHVYNRYRKNSLEVSIDTHKVKKKNISYLYFCHERHIYINLFVIREINYGKFDEAIVIPTLNYAQSFRP